MKNPEIRKLTSAIGKLSAAELSTVKKALARRERRVSLHFMATTAPAVFIFDPGRQRDGKR